MEWNLRVAFDKHRQVAEVITIFLPSSFYNHHSKLHDIAQQCSEQLSYHNFSWRFFQQGVVIRIVYQRSNGTCRMQFYGSRSPLILLKPLAVCTENRSDRSSRLLLHLDVRPLGPSHLWKTRCFKYSTNLHYLMYSEQMKTPSMLFRILLPISQGDMITPWKLQRRHPSIDWLEEKKRSTQS